MPHIKQARRRESSSSPKGFTGLSPLKKRARHSVGNAARVNVAPEDKAVKHALTALKVVNNAIPPSGILPVAIQRKAWPGLAEFETWVHFGDTFSVDDEDVWHRQLRTLLGGQSATADVKVYATDAARVEDDVPDQVGQVLGIQASPKDALDPDKTLYVFWMGCYNCLEPDDSEEGGLEHLVGMLIDHVQFLYSANARCFLIIDVPAVDRAPAHWEDADRVRGQISDWNELLRESVCAFAEEEEYSDVSLFVFSSHKMLSDLLDDVEEFGFDEEDERRVNGKIWVDREDVTVSKEVHRLLADKMQLAITLAEE